MQALHRNTQLSSSQFEILSHPGARETMVDLRGVPGGGLCRAIASPVWEAYAAAGAQSAPEPAIVDLRLA